MIFLPMAAFLILLGWISGCEKQPSTGSPPVPTPVPAPTPPSSTVTTSPSSDPPTTQASIPIVDLPALQELIKSSGSQKKITVIDFWATWCIPCVEIFPGLHEGLVKLGPSVRPVTVTLDGDDTIPNAVKFLQTHHALVDAYMLVPDTDKQLAVVAGLGKKWDNLVVPAVLVFDENGKLAAEFTLTVKTQDVLKQVKAMVDAKSK